MRSVDLKNNDIRSADIRNGTIAAKDVAKGTLLASNFKAGQLPAGAAGQNGQPGAPGPTFGDTKLIEGVQNIACNTLVSVGSMPVTVKQTSRIWASAQGSIEQSSATTDEMQLFARLKDGTGTVVASTPAMWDARGSGGDADMVNSMTTAGVMHAHPEPDQSDAPPYIAPAGTYTLELIAYAAGDCSGGNPDFGWNSNGTLGYVLLGTG